MTRNDTVSGRFPRTLLWRRLLVSHSAVLSASFSGFRNTSRRSCGECLMREHAAVVSERSNELPKNHRLPKRIFSGVICRGDRWLTDGDRPSENTLPSALLYCDVRSNLRESGKIAPGVNTYEVIKLKSRPSQRMRILQSDSLQH